MLVSAAGHSNVGLRRENNEDNFYISYATVNSVDDKTAVLSSCRSTVLALCDGMGGEESGEIASQITVNTIQKCHADILMKFNDAVIKKTVSMANDNVCRKMFELKKCMGTTLVLFAYKNGDAIVANVGDSRAYLFDNGVMTQISIDDTEAQRMVVSGLISKSDAMRIPENHRLTQNIGIPADELMIEPHIVHIEPKCNQKLLLCSDGLTDMVPESEIEYILSEKQSAEKIADKLVETAIENGGKDNVTAIVIEFKKKRIVNKIHQLFRSK